jgi:NAD(P)H dehydrogenase (quinone)
MWRAPSSAGWRHSATTWSQWSGTSKPQAGACHLALRIADYEDASALKRALAGIDDLVLISSDGDASAVMCHHANAIEAAMATNIRHITFTSIVDTDELSPFYFSPVPSQTPEELVLPTGRGRVAPISRDDVAAAVAAVATKPNKSPIIYKITGHRALGFGEIAAAYGETIVRPVRCPLTNT